MNQNSIRNQKLSIRPIYLIIAWTFMSVLYGIQSYYFFLYQGIRCNFFGTIFDQSPTFAIWGFYVPLIQFFLARFSLLKSTKITFNIMGHLITATILVALTVLIIGSGRWFYYSLENESYFAYLIRFTSNWFFFQYILYAVMVLLLMAIDYYNKFNEKQRHNMELQKLLVESQLNTLKMQLHPHFLFNTLNSISMLVRMGENKKANTVISRFGDLLRQVIESKDEQLVKLEKEFNLLDSYLSIEVVRFGENLSYKFDAGQDTLGLLIPDMLFQPIVENSIKHGMKNLKKPMHIEVKSFIENGNLMLSLSDNGSGFDSYDEQFLHKGIGLKNTIDRCNKMYGKNKIRIDTKPNEGTTVIFELPIINS